MDAKELAVLLQQVRAGRLSVEEAITRLKSELGLRSGSGSGSAGDSGNARTMNAAAEPRKATREPAKTASRPTIRPAAG